MEHRKRQQHNMPIQADSAIERRYSTVGLELRQTTEGAPTLRGYALRFGVAYNMGWFDEEVDRNALDGADLTDVRILFNHDANIILGRTAANTARVGIDDQGMWYEVDLPDSPNGENARQAVERGDVSQSSWGFSLRRDEAGKSIGDKWEVRNGRKYRTLTAIDVVYDASPVVYPANPDTSIAKRMAGLAGIEVRDEDMEGEMPGEGAPAPVNDGDPADQWTIQWMMGNLIWATDTSNSVVGSLNSRIDTYEYYASLDLKESPVFATLSASCKEVKAALIDLLDKHLDAAKVLNKSENRAANSVIEHERNEVDPTTDTIQSEIDDLDAIRMKMLSTRYPDK